MQVVLLLVVSHPNLSKAAKLLLTDRFRVVLRILKYAHLAVSWSPHCPSLSQCPLPSATAPLLSRGVAGSSLDPMRSICARCSGCAPQRVLSLAAFPWQCSKSISLAGGTMLGQEHLSVEGGNHCT